MFINRNCDFLQKMKFKKTISLKFIVKNMIQAEIVHFIIIVAVLFSIFFIILRFLHCFCNVWKCKFCSFLLICNQTGSIQYGFDFCTAEIFEHFCKFFLSTLWSWIFSFCVKLDQFFSGFKVGLRNSQFCIKTSRPY